MAKQKETLLLELQGIVGKAWRHRSGFELLGKDIDRIKLFKRTLYLDNVIPGLIADTFDNLNYITKDEQKPIIASRRKTSYGWHLVIHLPPGFSFSQVKNDLEFFSCATNSFIEVEWKQGNVHMNIQLGELPEKIPYEWDHNQYSNMELPLPVGSSRRGSVILDLCDSPHLLVGGATGFGKTGAVRMFVHALWERAIVVVLDPKQVDFYYLIDRCILALTDEEIYSVLMALNQEFERRVEILKRNRAVKVQECPEAIPYIVVVVDELAELNTPSMDLLDRLARLARATGISIIAASQRTSVKVIPGDTRANFVARLCFKVPTPADSRVILGEDCDLAAHLPTTKGRAIFRFGLDTQEVQLMNLPYKQAEQMALSMPQRGCDVDIKPRREPEKKRLRAR